MGTEQYSAQLVRLADLLARPTERLDVEIKSWLDLADDEGRAALAQAILAIANHGGGFVLIGFSERSGTWTSEDDTAGVLVRYTQDAVNGIVKRFADPPFHCELQRVAHPSTGQIHAIVVVPGDHQVPIRAKCDGGRHVRKDVYYIRRPGPSSEPPQNGAEWNELIHRCIFANRKQILDDIRNTILGTSQTAPSESRSQLQIWTEQSLTRWQEVVSERLPNESPSRFRYGTWFTSFQIRAEFEPPSLPELLEKVRGADGHETGWPPFLVMGKRHLEPYPLGDTIEAFLSEGERGPFEDAAHSDFWRATRRGLFFLLRGYQEDTQARDREPGTFIDLVLPIWRVGEILLFAARVAQAIVGAHSELAVGVKWCRLKGRVMAPWSGTRRYLRGTYRCHADEVESVFVTSSEQILLDLPGVTRLATDGLYEAFDFLKPPPSMYAEEIAKMQKRST
jgi:hypothetical protein